MAKPLTMKDISARVDQLSMDLNGGLQILREEFVKLKNAQQEAIIPDQSENSDFIARLNSFQDTINSSLSNLVEEMSAMKEELANIHGKENKMETRQNENSIIIHGLIPESNDLYPTILKFFADKLNINNLSKSDIYYCYLLRKKTSPAAARQIHKQSPVVVQFVTRWARNLVFFKKKLLKGSKFLITELLTVNTLVLFKKAREIFKNSSWTLNGVIYISSADGKKVIKSDRDLCDVNTVNGVL